MITLPEGLFALDGYPGYFYDKEEAQLYSLKIGGVLKPLRMYTWIFSKYSRKLCEPHYVLSRNNRRHYLFMHDLMKILVSPDVIPIERKAK